MGRALSICLFFSVRVCPRRCCCHQRKDGLASSGESGLPLLFASKVQTHLSICAVDAHTRTQTRYLNNNNTEYIHIKMNQNPASAHRPCFAATAVATLSQHRTCAPAVAAPASSTPAEAAWTRSLCWGPDAARWRLLACSPLTAAAAAVGCFTAAVVCYCYRDQIRSTTDDRRS